MINRTHGGNIRAYLNTDNSLKKLIDFSVNINPLGLPPKVKEVILKNIDNLLHYPEPESAYLKKDLANFYNISSHNLLVGNGSIEFIHLVPQALKVKEALIITPTFSEYEFALKANGVRSIFVNTIEGNDFKINVTEIKKFIPRVDLIFLCNPNNPTGIVMPLDEILALTDLCKKYGVVLLIDEVFMDFVEKCEESTLVTESIQNKSVLVLRSLTKFFAIPGLRLGYLIGHRDLISKIAQFQYPWNVNALAQAVGREVLKDKDFILKSKEFVFKERRYLFDKLKRIKGLKVYPPSANFIFCKLKDANVSNAGMLTKRLIKQGVIIRNCDNFRGLNDKFFRVAVKNRKENILLVSNLRKILG